MTTDGSKGGYGEPVSSHLRFQALTSNSPVAIIEWDSEHHIVCWTGAAQRIFGWDASEVVGRRADDWRFVYEDDQALVRQATEAMQRGENFVSRNRNYRKDGAVIHCEWYNSVLIDQMGRFRGGLSLVLDTTARDEAERDLQLSEQKHRGIVDTAPIGIFRTLPEGRFVSVNAKMAEMFGFESPEQMIAAVRSIGDELYVNARQRTDLIERAKNSPDFVPYEIEFRRRDGSTFTANLYLRVVRDSQGRVAHLEGFLQDITEQKRLVESLRKAQLELEDRVRERTAELSQANERLLELDRLKSQFLASMSHELRTPLNSIIGFTSLLRRELTGPLNSEQRKQLEIVQSSARHLLTLINDLLDVSRIEAGRADLEREPFDCAEVIAEAVKIVQPMGERKGLEIAVEAAPTIPMFGDRKRTLQVLLNLVNNAIKFTEKGRVTVSVTVEGKTLRMAVADTGIGIKPEHMGMLFEAFRQVDGSAKRVYEGTGLGLYLCRKLLRLMGGDITAESVYGAGSRFTIVLPVEPEAESVERG